MNPIATVQVDMDPLWFVFPDIDEFTFEREDHSIYTSILTTFLDLFKQYDIKATFFIVGRDLEKDQTVRRVERILDAGHEIANHTYTHASFNGNSFREKVQDIEKFETILSKRLGVSSSGFKAPCYAIDDKIIRYLNGGYLYDSSMISVSIAPLLRLYYRMKARGRFVHPNNWGAFLHLFAPRTPYRYDPRRIHAKGAGPLISLPVTTMPLFSLPTHFSFINIFGYGYFDFQFRFLKLLRRPFLNFAFHAIDLYEFDKLGEQIENGKLSGRPGALTPFRVRLKNAREVLKSIKKSFTILRSDEIAQKIVNGEIVF